jgi:hypothetical protein
MNNNTQKLLERDAKRYRALMRHFKHDHIWYDVMGSPEGMGRSVNEVLDNLVNDPKTYYVYDYSYTIN